MFCTSVNRYKCALCASSGANIIRLIHFVCAIYIPLQKVIKICCTSYMYFIQKLLADVENRKPSVDGINKSAAKLLSTTTDAAEARALQSKLDALNTRFERLSGPARSSCDFLQRLSDRLGRLQDEVDKLEDWLIPMLDLLKAPDLSQKDLTELGTILQVGPKE